MKNKKAGKIFALSILALLMVSFFVSAISAQDDIVREIPGSSYIKDWFAKWSSGSLDVNIAKYLFLILLIIFVFSILSVVPAIKDMNDFLKWIFSVVVGFLATAYIAPEEIYAMLIGYTTLGIVLGGIVPFLILFFYTYEVAKEGKAGGIMFQRILWIIFFIVLVYRYIMGIIRGELTTSMSITYGIILGIALIAIIANSWIVNWIKEQYDQTMSTVAESAAKGGAAGILIAKGFADRLGGKKGK